MIESAKTPFDLLLDQIRAVVREEIKAALSNGSHGLMTAEKLADELAMPVSWVYEQSRLGNIPTQRIGRYLRFDLQAVLNSEAAKRANKNGA